MGIWTRVRRATPVALTSDEHRRRDSRARLQALRDLGWTVEYLPQFPASHDSTLPDLFAATTAAAPPSMIDDAIAAYVTVDRLEPVPYSPVFASKQDEGIRLPVPCGACGHPRWAHAIPGFVFDGLCIVSDCPCHEQGSGGYQPSRPR